jgi:hypothetical protein
MMGTTAWSKDGVRFAAARSGKPVEEIENDRLAAAVGTTCAINQQGEVWCWGRNKDRQASTASPAWSLAAVELAPSRIMQIVGACPAASSVNEAP